MMNWIEIIENDYNTYPDEGTFVIVSDGKNQDIAYYIMSSTYKWVKYDLVKNDIIDFTSFVISKWSYIT